VNQTTPECPQYKTCEFSGLKWNGPDNVLECPNASGGSTLGAKDCGFSFGLMCRDKDKKTLCY